MSESGLVRRIDRRRDACQASYVGVGVIPRNVALLDDPPKPAQGSRKVAAGLPRWPQLKWVACGLWIARNGCGTPPCRSGPIEGQDLRIDNAEHSLLLGNVDQIELCTPGDVAKDIGGAP
jgi:hypothetical protein